MPVHLNVTSEENLELEYFIFRFHKVIGLTYF